MSGKFRSAIRMARGWRVPIIERFKVFPLSEVEKYGNNYFKEAIMVAPALVGMLAAAPLTLGVILFTMWYDQDKNMLKDRPFKKLYTVYRPDDPMIERMMWRPAYYNHEGTVPDKPVTGMYQT